MQKVRYVPYDAAREEEKELDKKERRAMKNDPIEEGEEEEFELDPEIDSTDAFAAHMIDGEERAEYTHLELRCLCARLKMSSMRVRDALEQYGLQLARREVPREVRGFSSNPHNLYAGNPMSGGGGGDSIQGFAGRKG